MGEHHPGVNTACATKLCARPDCDIGTDLGSRGNSRTGADDGTRRNADIRREDGIIRNPCMRGYTFSERGCLREELRGSGICEVGIIDNEGRCGHGIGEIRVHDHGACCRVRNASRQAIDDA